LKNPPKNKIAPKTYSYLYRLDDGKEIEELESISKKGEELSETEDLLKIYNSCRNCSRFAL